MTLDNTPVVEIGDDGTVWSCRQYETMHIEVRLTSKKGRKLANVLGTCLGKYRSRGKTPPNLLLFI